MKTYYAVHSDKTHVQVENLEDFVARFSTESDWKMIEADSEGWIAHTGNECPLPDDCLCEVWVKGAKRPFALENPQKLYWSELFSYRPILTEQAKPVQEPEIPEPPECMWPDCACERHDCFDFEMPEPSERQLLDCLKAAHEHAQQIPDLEAELREVLGSMGYDLVSRNPFAQQRHGAQGE